MTPTRQWPTHFCARPVRPLVCVPALSASRSSFLTCSFIVCDHRVICSLIAVLIVCDHCADCHAG